MASHKSDDPNTFQLGCCYYPEHWPQTQWADQARAMRDLGLNFVRIGEFAWSRIEPRQGAYQWDWLDHAVETLAETGLKVIMGTPTATPPKWLIDANPEILAVTEHGTTRHFGSRRHYSFSSPIYRDLAATITDRVAARYASHNAVIMWQTDNEYGCHDTVLSYDEAAIEGFRFWLEDKYGDINTLNHAWGNVFWSREYTKFSQIDPPNATVTEAGPEHCLDWQRYSSDQVNAFNARMVQAIRQHSDKPITHNFMGHFTAFDHYKLGTQLDIASWDSYPLGFLEVFDWPEYTKARYAKQGHPDFAAFHHDLYRAAGLGRWGVMEQQPGPVNWAPYNPCPRTGMVALWTAEAFAHGAEFVSYFRWQQTPFAQEQMHAGLNLPNGEPSPATKEIRALNAQLSNWDQSPTTQAPIALIFDYETEWAQAIQPQGQNWHYQKISLDMYRAARRLGLNLDVCSPNADLSDYKLVLCPSLLSVSEQHIAHWQEIDAHILFGPRTGARTPTHRIPDELPPGALQKLLPFRVLQVESLRPGMKANANGYKFHSWREIIKTEHKTDYVFRDTQSPALVRFGRLAYLAGWPENMRHFVKEAAQRAGLKTLTLPAGIRIRRRADTCFIFNYSDQAITLAPLAKKLNYTKLTDEKAYLAAADFVAWKIEP